MQIPTLLTVSLSITLSSILQTNQYKLRALVMLFASLQSYSLLPHLWRQLLVLGFLCSSLTPLLLSQQKRNCKLGCYI